MSKCENCIHYDACKKISDVHGLAFGSSQFCDLYKSKSLFVELPCKVGDKVYKPIITSRGKPAIWEIIITSINVDVNKENCVSPNSYAIGHLKNTHCGESADFYEFGKTVFLTKEEAEKKLKEMENLK